MNEILLGTTGPKGSKVAGLNGMWSNKAVTFPNFGTTPCWCQVGQFVYILTGANTNTNVPFYRLDLVTGSYTTLSRPTRPSYTAEMAYADGKIYVFDGYGSTTMAAYVWVYTIANDSWAYYGSLSSYGARGRGRSFVQGTKIYNIGGIGAPTGNGVYFSDEIYDLIASTRSESGRIITDWTGNQGKGVLIGNSFYYTRAYNATSDAMYRYDIATRTITKLADNPKLTSAKSASGGIGVVAVNGYLAQRNKTQVDFYDTATDTWLNLPDVIAGPTFTNNTVGNIIAFWDGALYCYDVSATTTATKLLWKMT